MSMNFFTYGTDNKYNCTRCRWEGYIPDFVDGDKTEKALIYDVYCPTCKKVLGYWQAPIINFLLPDDVLKRKQLFKNWLKSLLAIMMLQKTNETNALALNAQSCIEQKPPIAEKKKKSGNKPNPIKII